MSDIEKKESETKAAVSSEKTLAIILRMLHNEKRKETTQKGMKQPTVHKGNDI